MIDPWLIFTGLTIGLLVGATGIGGGSLTTPILILFFRVPPLIAVGTDLVYATVTKALGSWQHLRQGSVNLTLTLYLAAGSLPGSLMGVRLLTWLNQQGWIELDDVITRLAGAMLILASGFMIYRALSPKGAGVRGTLDFNLGRKVQTALSGLLVGLLISTTSLGSGVLVVLLLALFYNLPMSRVVGTDIFHAAILTATAGLAHLHQGNVDPSILSSLLLGSIPGVLIGSRLTLMVPERGLRLAIALIFLILGLKLGG